MKKEQDMEYGISVTKVVERLEDPAPESQWVVEIRIRRPYTQSTVVM